MNLTPDPTTGFYVLPVTLGAPVVHVSPDGSDGNTGGPGDPVATLAAARKKLPKGQPGAMFLRAGGRWVDQQMWVDGGAGPDAPQVIATYGGDQRAVVDCSSPVPGESALQARGTAFISDIEFVCEPGRSGCVARGKFELVAQNVLVRDAGMGWDLSETTARLHRCLVLDCYDPKGDRSQGTYITKGRVLRVPVGVAALRVEAGRAADAVLVRQEPLRVH
jgi:hypothetical protein